MTNPDARLVLMRHGETEWSSIGRHTGNTDIPLTERGEEQARAAAGSIAALHLRNPLIITSPRQRALRTAELAGLTVDQTWDDLTEWDYGDFEGLTTPQIRETVPNWTVFTHRCPNGESTDDVQARADTVLAVVTPQLDERDVILIGHGHFSRALIARWLSMPVSEGKRFAMSAAAHSVLGYERDVQQLVSHNAGPS